MRIENGGNTQRFMLVDADGRAYTLASASKRIHTVSKEHGRAYSAVAVDAGPVAAEYTLYLQNTSSTYKLILNKIIVNAHDADVRWKLHEVTGTGSGTTITPVNLNLESSNVAEATCLGGAAGVTGLTSSAVLLDFFNGAANASKEVDLDDSVILGKNQAVALEYDAGTGGACSITVPFYYE